MKMTMTATFKTTITELNLADSLTPITRTIESNTTTKTAGRFMTPRTIEPSASFTCSNGDANKVGGRAIPKSLSMDCSVADHPTDTVAAPTAYSNTRTQPMIQARSSHMGA